ncbi:MAG: hypothetical protein PHW95_00905 [Patescibacteria group bacterium]|nr:hypothetical protein [Patescibacteria group bacterium]
MAVAIVVIFSLLGLFLYQYFYQTIAQSEEIVLLKQEVAPDILDDDKVKKVLNRLDLKESTSTVPLAVNNPFKEQKKSSVQNSTINNNATSTQN